MLQAVDFLVAWGWIEKPAADRATAHFQNCLDSWGTPWGTPGLEELLYGFP